MTLINGSTVPEKYRSRKWMLTVFVSLVSTLGLFFGVLDGVHFATIMAVLIPSYSVANVFSKEMK